MVDMAADPMIITGEMTLDKHTTKKNVDDVEMLHDMTFSAVQLGSHSAGNVIDMAIFSNAADPLNHSGEYNRCKARNQKKNSSSETSKAVRNRLNKSGE